ncbi:hypothetical protein IT575_10895 [bacterium]|nr:hypothetical protein [bacterium]
MRFFIVYRHSGADLIRARIALELLQAELQALGHSSYCTLIDGAELACGGSSQAVLELGVRELCASDALLLYVESSQASLGMYIEVGVAIARRMPVYLLRQEQAQAPYLGELAAASAQFDGQESLAPALKQLLAAV